MMKKLTVKELKIRRESRLQRRRDIYASKKDELNRIRRNKYAIATTFTSNSIEARKYRGYGLDRIQVNHPEVRFRPTTKVFYIYTKPKITYQDQPLTKAEVRRIKRVKRRREARELGYTPKEADYLRNVADSKWEDIVKKGIIVDPKGRISRWAKMSDNTGRTKFSDKIEEACEAINIEAGYDPQSRYGWAVYYFWYVNGGDIEGWKGYVLADPFNPNALGYGKENIFSF